MDSQNQVSWKELAEQKEKEWKQVTHLRIESLEASKTQTEQDLKEQKIKFQKLKEDFKYNLKLLQERDQELERYDATFTEFKAQVNNKNLEISESKILLDEMRTRFNQMEKGQKELQLHYQQRLKEKQTEIDAFRCNKDAELNEQRKQFEDFKRNLDQKLTEVGGELDVQKRELAADFEDTLKKREHEARLKHDEMSAKVLEYELKAKLFSKELEFLRASQKQVTAGFCESENQKNDLEKKLKEKEWDIIDNKAMADARITELESELKQMGKNMNRLDEDHNRKYSDMDKCLREREEALSKIKDSYLNREQTLTNNIRDQQQKLETAEIEFRQLQWTNQDLMKEKEIKTHKSKEELQELQDKWDKCVADMSRSQVSRDLEVHCMRENDSKLKLEILQLKQDTERYKKELTLAAEREAVLERCRTQLELDWQNRYEEAERVQYEKSEDFIKKVTTARDEALAAVKEKTRALERQETLLRTVQRDRDIVMATLKKHGIPVDKNLLEHIEDINYEEMKQIQQQNNHLKDAITQMRQQMESLRVSDTPVSGSCYTDKDYYISSLEEQVESLKQIVQQKSKQTDSPNTEKTADTDNLPDLKNNIIVQDHVQSLNEQIGILRSENTEVNVQFRKLKARLHSLELSSDKTCREHRQKKVEIDQLKYELSTTKQRHEAETSSLKQRISELELQLAETRKEADEYYRGSLERNMEATALGNQLSVLKMEMAESRPTINLGAQELVIHQLQDEIMRLKQNRDDETEMGLLDNIHSIDPKYSYPILQDLRSKLKKAVIHIAQLTKEKQQLIEVGNRLRGQLKKAGATPTSSQHITSSENIDIPSTNAKPQQQLSQDFINKLNQLEKLQYQLTRQELQFAQRFSPPKLTVERSNTQPSILKKTTSTHDISRSTGNHNVDPILMSMSSGGGESILQVWNMLEDRSSPGLTPRAPTHIEEGNNAECAQWSIEGRKTELRPKDKKPTYHTKLKQTKKPVVRNYNKRDDSTYLKQKP